jgi:hypothetical protein
VTKSYDPRHGVRLVPLRIVELRAEREIDTLWSRYHPTPPLVYMAKLSTGRLRVLSEARARTVHNGMLSRLAAASAAAYPSLASPAPPPGGAAPSSADAGSSAGRRTGDR